MKSNYSSTLSFVFVCIILISFIPTIHAQYMGNTCDPNFPNDCILVSPCLDYFIVNMDDSCYTFTS